jgi:hypothetical protein
MKLVTSGRTDVDDFFRLSGIRESKRLSHTPFLVFSASDDGIEVRIVDNAKTLLAYSDDTKVMAQWSGNYKSDFFHFNVGDFREYVTKSHQKRII